MTTDLVGALVLLAIFIGIWLWLTRRPRHRFCSKCGAPMAWAETGSRFVNGSLEPPVIGYDPTSGRPVRTGWCPRADVHVPQPVTPATMSWEELEAAGLCECGQALDDHPSLAKPLPWSYGRPCSKTALERGYGWDGRQPVVHTLRNRSRWSSLNQVPA